MPRKPKPPTVAVSGESVKPIAAKSDGKAKRMANLTPWPPGVSGNPSGRPRSTIEMKQQAAAYTDSAMKLKGMVTELQLKQASIYAERANDPSLTVDERLEMLNKAIKSIDGVGLGAAQSLLDRGHGKPQQKVEVDHRTVIDEMDDDEVGVFIGTMGPQVVALIHARRKAKT